MASLIGIAGKPGDGKSYGIKELNPETTRIINADGKPLPFKGAKKDYIEGQNIFTTSEPEAIKRLMEKFNLNKGVKTVVIDTASAIMNDTEMRTNQAKEGKPISNTLQRNDWYDNAKVMYNLIKILQDPRLYRPDLYIFILFHTLTGDDNITKIKTNGRKLEQIGLEGCFTNLFFTKVEDTNEGFKYSLISGQDSLCLARSYDQCFDKEIPNNYQLIIDSIERWENEENI